jgi:hypothetical protein
MSSDDRQFFVEHLDIVLQRIGEIVGPLKDDVVTIKDKLESSRKQDKRITKLEKRIA